jgi:hypothetical protein
MSEEKKKRGTKTVHLNTQGIGKPNLDTVGLALHRTQTLTLIWTCDSSLARTMVRGAEDGKCEALDIR